MDLADIVSVFYLSVKGREGEKKLWSLCLHLASSDPSAVGSRTILCVKRVSVCGFSSLLLLLPTCFFLE